MASSKSFFSLLAGLAAGAAFGILYAKASQAKASLKDIRETLRSKGAEIKEDTRDMLLRQLERLENALKQAEETAEEAVSEQPDEQAPEA